MNIYYKTSHKLVNFIIKYSIFSIVLFLLINLILLGKEAKAVAVYEDTFDNNLNNWQIVDLAKKASPSKWQIKDNSLYQASNIGNGFKFKSTDHRGSILLFKNFIGNNFEMKVDFSNKDDDGVGVVFGYIDQNNFYQIIISREKNEAILSKIINGNAVILSDTTDTYIQNQWQNLKIVSNNNKVTIYLENKIIANTDFSQTGKVGLSVWANTGVSFDNFSLNKTDSVTKSTSPLISTQKNINKKYQPMYLIDKNKKHKILNEDVLDDYRAIIETITLVEEKDSKQYPYASLVTTKENPDIYYINQALKKKKIIPNKEIFLAYKNRWEDVITISKKDLESYSNIKVVKSADSPIIYELHNDFKTIINSPSKLAEAGYKWSEVVTIKQIELDYYPTKIVDSENIKVAGVEYSENENIDINGNLSIKNIKNDQEMIVPGGTILNLLKLELTADQSNPVYINAIEFSRPTGVTLIEEIVVMNSEQKVIGRAKLLNKRKLKVVFPLGILIGPNTSKIINVKGIIEKRDDTSYERLSVESVESIESSANITASFPITGDNFKVIVANKLIGQLRADGVLVDAGLRNTSLGTKDQLITKFSLKEISNNEDVYLKRLTVTQTASKNAQITNIDLVDQNNKVISTVAKPDDRDIVFNLSQVPYRIKKDSNQIFSIRADIVDGIGSNIKMEIKDKIDIVAESTTYNFILTPTTTNSFPIGRGNSSYVNRVQINDTNILVYKNKVSPTGDLISGAKNQLLGVFDIKTSNIALIYKAITLKLINNGGTVLEDDLIITNGKQILGQIPAPANNQTATIYFDDNTKIDANKTFSFYILGSVNKKSTVLDTYQVQISSIDFVRPDNGDDYSFDYIAYGNTLGVKLNSLTITSTGGDRNASTNKTNILIGEFAIQAGVVEDIVVNAFNINEVANYKTINSNDGYNNLRIQVNGKDYAKYPNPNGGSFVVNQPFTVKAGKSASIKVYVDTISPVDNDQIKLSINNVTAYGANSNLTPSKTGDGRESFATRFKQNRLDIIKNPEMNNALIVGGGGSQKVASFVFTNNSVDDIKVINFTLAETTTSNIISYDNGYSKFKATNVISNPIAGGTKFNGFTIRAGATYTINVYISPDASAIGDIFNLIIKDIKVDGSIIVTGNSTAGQNVNVVAGQ